MDLFIQVFWPALAILAVFIVGVWLLGKKRTAALRAVAVSLEFTFSRKASASFVSSLSQFHLCSQGLSRKVSNVMTGSANGVDVSIFDYQYTTVSLVVGFHTFQQTVVLLRSSMLHLPRFTLWPGRPLRPGGLVHTIGSALGYQNIDFDSNPTFSRQYLLRAADEQACRDVFTDSVLGYYDQHKGLSTEGDGDTLLFYRASKRVAPADIRSLLEEWHGVVGLFTTEAEQPPATKHEAQQPPATKHKAQQPPATKHEAATARPTPVVEEMAPEAPRRRRDAAERTWAELITAQRVVLVLGGLLLLGVLLYPPWIVTADLVPARGRHDGLVEKRHRYRSDGWVFSPPVRYQASSPAYLKWVARAAIDGRRLFLRCAVVIVLTALAVRIPFGALARAVGRSRRRDLLQDEEHADR